MTLPDDILRRLSERIGHDVTTHNGVAMLRKAIQAETGQLLSTNTLKRLTGILAYSATPRLSTLDIIAEYLGAPSWRALTGEGGVGNGIDADECGDAAWGSSAFVRRSVFTDLARLKRAAVVALEWEPGRHVEIWHVGEGVYEVERSEGSKLRPGDRLTLSQVAVGFPLYISDVVRDGVSLGAYRAAATRGLTAVEIDE